MLVHSDIIIFELLKLYFEATDENTINISTLKKGFYTFLKIINKKENITLNFELELYKFLDNYSDYFNVTNGEVQITDDIAIVFNAIIDSHEKLSIIDYDLQELVFDLKIYRALNIDLPYEEVQEYFELNKTIIKLYLKLGENELHNYYDELLFKKLTNCINQLKEKLNEAPSNALTKLKVCLTFFNTELISNNNTNQINSVWNIILFSNNVKKLYSLSYDRLEYLVTMIDPETDEESEEILDNFFQDNNEETIEEYEQNKEIAANELDEIPYFLTIFLIELNNYLKNNPDSIAKEALLIKKYLLISTPELNHVEKYLLENHSLDNYPAPAIPEDLDSNYFEGLKNKVINCTTYLVANNQELTKPHILGKVITSALFIKTFLELSINSNSIQDIIDLIINSVYYKQPGYEIVTNLVDELIFNDNPNLQR